MHAYVQLCGQMVVGLCMWLDLAIQRSKTRFIGQITYNHLFRLRDIGRGEVARACILSSPFVSLLLFMVEDVCGMPQAIRWASVLLLVDYLYHMF